MIGYPDITYGSHKGIRQCRNSSVNEAEVRVEEVSCIPWEYGAVCEKNLPVKEQRQPGQENGDEPFTAATVSKSQEDTPVERHGFLLK